MKNKLLSTPIGVVLVLLLYNSFKWQYVYDWSWSCTLAGAEIIDKGEAAAKVGAKNN